MESIRKVDRDEAKQLSDFFKVPEKLACYMAFFGKGKERAVANVKYNAIYNWQGCKFARKIEGCEKCAIIACPDFLEGPGMKRYTIN